jgi:hypothetical protein
MAKSNPTDGEQAAAAFRQQADPIGPAASKPPQEPAEAQPPVTTERESMPPVDLWDTGAGETNEKLQAP